MEEILTSLHEREDIQIESSYSDRKESNLVNTFLADGCRCKLNYHVSIGREAILSDTGVIVQSFLNLSSTWLSLDSLLLWIIAALHQEGCTEEMWFGPTPVASSILREKIYAQMLSCFFME